MLCSEARWHEKRTEQSLLLEREREGEDEILAADYHLPPAELDEEERDAKLPRRSNRTMMEGQGEAKRGAGVQSLDLY